jgi:hypothetical protein
VVYLWWSGAEEGVITPWFCGWDKSKKQPIVKQCTAPYAFLTKTYPFKAK